MIKWLNGYMVKWLSCKTGFDGYMVFLLLFVVSCLPAMSAVEWLAVDTVRASEITLYLGPVERTFDDAGNLTSEKVYIGAGNTTIVKISNEAQGTSDKLNYLYADHLGSTVLITKEDGTKETSLQYYPYGNETVTSQQGTSDKLYTGQRKDSSSDLYFYNARYYNPNIGNFISADKAEGPNRYAYVGNNPVMRNDPSGNVMSAGDDGGGGGGSSSISLNEINPNSNIQSSGTYNNTLGIQTPITPDVDLYCMDHDCLNVAPKTIEEKIQPFVQLLYIPVMYAVGAGEIYEVVDTALCGVFYDPGMCMTTAMLPGPAVRRARVIEDSADTAVPVINIKPNQYFGYDVGGGVEAQVFELNGTYTKLWGKNYPHQLDSQIAALKKLGGQYNTPKLLSVLADKENNLVGFQMTGVSGTSIRYRNVPFLTQQEANEAIKQLKIIHENGVSLGGDIAGGNNVLFNKDLRNWGFIDLYLEQNHKEEEILMQYLSGLTKK